MDLGLSGKHALVTGSTAGIGLAISQANVDAALKRIREAAPDAKITGIVADCATAAGAGVTVNALLPGPTHTESTDRLRAERAQAAGITLAEIGAAFFRDFRPTSLLRRFTSADEVAALGVHLCSEAASGTSGAAMRVDSGVVNQIM